MSTHRSSLASGTVLLALAAIAGAQTRPAIGNPGNAGKSPAVGANPVGGRPVGVPISPVASHPGVRPLPGNRPVYPGWSGRHWRWRPSWDYGYYGYSGVQFVGPYYGGIYPSYGLDPYGATLQLQNNQLQQQLDQAMAANRQLQQNAEQNRNRVNVPLKRKRDDDRADREREKNQAAKSKQLAAAGNRLFAAGLFAKAAERYRDALRADADDASNYFLLAQAQFANKQYADAVRSLKDGLKLNPDWIENEFDLRALYANADQLTPQLAEIARVVKVNPLDRDASFLLGFELFMTGQKEKSRAILEQAARLEIDDRHLKPFFDYFDKQANAN